MNSSELVRERLRNQHLLGNELPAPADVVGWLGAMQAQDYPGAKWSIGARTAGGTAAEVDHALAAGTILRTHILRPTWHLVLPSDIRWMQQLTAPRVHAQMAPYRRSLGLDEALFAASERILGAALARGERLTRPEISALLRRQGIAVDGVRLGHVLMRAELDLVICSGGLRGKQQTYALLDERAPAVQALPRDDALATLAVRYYTSHGPATDRDFAWWSGLTLADVRRGIGLAGTQLESTAVGPHVYWFAPAGRQARVSRTVHLLQAYDEFVIGYSQSRHLLDLAGIVTSGADERFHIHVVILDGQVVARWRRVANARSLTVEVRLERSLAPAERRALDVAVARYARFMEMPVQVVVER